MFGSRRLAKRSIVGTRVSAPWQDGRYYPGVIESTRSSQIGEIYTVFFEDGYRKDFRDNEIYGPGFLTVTSIRVKHGQKVYITYNGREIQGVVIRHDHMNDEILISARLNNGENKDIEITRKLEDVRLIESRKSARLQDQDTDYSKLADLTHPEAKKRAVSHVIDVPNKISRRRSGSPEQDSEENVYSQADVEMMDEHTAALVLTSLSCSPVSPQLPQLLEPGVSTNKWPETAEPASFSSSGFASAKSGGSTPSPPYRLSGSAPVATVFSSSQIDEGIELDETNSYFSTESSGTPRKRRNPTKTMYQCTWPNCGKIQSTCSGIERHVRSAHLGPKAENGSDSEELSDHEEEFYYTEVEVTVDTVTEHFANMYTSSPPQQCFMDRAVPIMDHDYQKKESRVNPQNISKVKTQNTSLSCAPSSSHPTTFTVPVSIPQISRSLSWQLPLSSSPTISSPGRSMKLSPQERLQQHQAQSPKTHSFFSSSPKSSPMHKKSRSDVKKCRKVYGMENRDMWCTQCKWKKACTRFLD